MQVAHGVREVLARATCEGITVRLPPGVNTALNDVGARTAKVLTWSPSAWSTESASPPWPCGNFCTGTAAGSTAWRAKSWPPPAVP